MFCLAEDNRYYSTNVRVLTLALCIFYHFSPPPSPSHHPSRVFPGAAGQLGKVSQQDVHADVREAVHAELGGVPGPVHGAQTLLHRRQRQPRGDAE